MLRRRDLLLAPAAALAARAQARVVIARGATPDAARVLSALDRALQACYECNSPMEAWKKIARPGEVVGLKVNCLAGRGASTNIVLVDAICERLQQAGIPARDIVIWDRLNADLESAGFRVSTRGDRIRYVGNDSAGYEDELTVSGSAGSLLARSLTRTCHAVINLPVLKDHGIVGVTMALKNMFGAIHNPNKYHLTVGDPYVADVFAMEPIRRKVRLTICDAISAQYEGGPSYMPQWQWPLQGLLISRDPVALDAVGWDIIEKKRAEKGMKPLRAVEREPRYIASAAKRGLGIDRLDLIERKEV